MQREVENLQKEERKLCKPVKSFPKNIQPENARTRFILGHVWSLAVFSMYVKVQSQNTASAHKVRHTSSHISNNCYPETQKALRDLLSDRIKRGTPCENRDRGAKWDCEIESGDVAL